MALFRFMLTQLALRMLTVNAEMDSASDALQSLFSSTHGLQISGSVLGTAAVVVGVVLALLGYRLFRVTLFLVGFMAGGFVTALVVESELADKSWVVTASWASFVLGGVVTGVLLVLVYKLGIFLAGAAAGVMLAMLLSHSVAYQIYPSHPHLVLYVLSVVLGLACGLLVLKAEKPVIIVATSLLGSGICAWGVGYFAGDLPSTRDLQKHLPNAWWAYLVGISVLFVIGLIVQFRSTARGESDSLKSRSLKRVKSDLHTPSTNGGRYRDGIFVV